MRAFGEPDRKGGGERERVPVWLEWGRVELVLPPDGPSETEGEKERGTTAIGLMVDLQRPDPAAALTEEQKKKGLGGVWDRAAGCKWATLKLFKPDTSARQNGS